MCIERLDLIPLPNTVQLFNAEPAQPRLSSNEPHRRRVELVDRRLYDQVDVEKPSIGKLGNIFLDDSTELTRLCMGKHRSHHRVRVKTK